MADLKISQLNSLAGSSLANTDVLAVVDTSASETKKITSKELVQYGYGLVDPSTLDGNVIEPGTTSARGTVQLTDSTGSTSTTTAATPNAVKSAYDLANAALPKAGGTMTGQILGDDSTSASTPGYAFDGDPDTGLLRTGANELGLVTGGTARLTIDASGNVVIPGNFTVQGTTTTIDTTTLVVEDKNIEMGAVATPTDVTADGGGITLKGTTDKTINWVDATDAWTSSERFSVPTGTAAAPTLTFTGDPNTGIYSPGADQVAISTGGSGRLFVDASGRVLVNSSSARTNILATNSVGFQLEGTNFDSSNLVSIRNSADSGAANLILCKTRSATVGGTTAVQTGDQLGVVRFTGSDGTTFIGGATIQSHADGTMGTGVMPGYLAFSTTASGSGSPQERLRITSAGLVGIGTSAPSEALTVAGNIRANNTNARIGAYGANGSSPGLVLGNSAGTSHYIIYETVDGSGNRGSLNFFDSVASSNRLAIDTSGNVGIGTTSPRSTLTVAGQYSIDNNTTDPNDGAAYLFQQGGVGWNLASTNIAFSTGGSGSRSERARIDSSGRLLVGTSSNRTGAALQVEGTTFGTSLATITNNSANSAPAYFQLIKSRGTSVGSQALVANGDGLGNVQFVGTDGTQQLVAAAIEGVVDGTPGTNDMPGRLVFSTTADGASSPIERMRIAQNGVITIQNGAVAVIGTLTDAATITPDFAADCNFTVTLGGNRTIANPTNLTAGQSGSIFLVQDATGGRTASWGSYWDFPGGTAPTLSTAANAVDRVDYIVRSSTSIHTVFTANYS